MGLGLLEYFIIAFSVFIAIFLIYMAYVCYLKKYKGYRYENGIPDVTILRQSRNFGSAGLKHFSAASFRASQLSLSSVDRAKLAENSGRPHTFPLSSSAKAKASNLPEIRIEQV